MKVIGTTVLLPAEDKEVFLPGIKYGVTWVVEFTSMRWTVDKEEKDRIRILWTVSADSGRSRPQRCRFEIELLDDSGEPVATVVKNLILRPSTKDQKFKVKMKVPLEGWSTVERLRVQVNFFVGS